MDPSDGFELRVNGAESRRPWALHLGRGGPVVRVVDDLLTEPDQVRSAALALGFQPPTSRYPGMVAPIAGPLDRFAAELSELAVLPIAPSQLSANFSMVTKCSEELTPAQRNPHVDEAVLAGVLYLNPPDQCRGGTAFYRHRETGLFGIPAGFDIGVYLQMARRGFRDFGPFLEWIMTPGDPELAFMFGSTETWERVGFVEMRYNRLVVYDGRLFHSGVVRGGDFGEIPERRRLTLNVFVHSTETHKPQQRRTTWPSNL